jgi:hypothetical protein
MRTEQVGGARQQYSIWRVEINCEGEAYWGNHVDTVRNCRVSEQKLTSLAMNTLCH